MELALELGWKIALTALMIVAVARVAERAGALMASVLLTVPMNAGPGFFFLALDHPAPFIAEGVLVSFAATGAVLVFAAAYVNLARRFDFFVCVGGASLAWLIAAIAFSWVELDLARACALIAGGALIAFVSRRRLDLYSAPDHGPSALRPQFARGLVAGAWAAGFATLGHLIGPKLAGLAFGFPIIFCTAAWTVHRTHGGNFAAALLSSAQRSLVTYASFCLALYLLVAAMAPLPAFGLACLVMVAVAGSVAAVGWYARRGALRPQD